MMRISLWIDEDCGNRGIEGIGSLFCVVHDPWDKHPAQKNTVFPKEAYCQHSLEPRGSTEQESFPIEKTSNNPGMADTQPRRHDPLRANHIVHYRVVISKSPEEF